MIGALAIWASLAGAAPVLCDAARAERLLTEARIDPTRAPITHPELVPGLARASDDAPLRAALAELCAEGVDLTIARGEGWQQSDWSAWTVLVLASRVEACAVHQRGIALSVTILSGARPQYRLRSWLPITQTPIGGCDTEPHYRTESTVAGDEGRVRVVVAADHRGDDPVSTELLVRWATPTGWHEQHLRAPAPPRLHGGQSGSLVTLVTSDDTPWLVLHDDRQVTDTGCVNGLEPEVWQLQEDKWVQATGRAALGLLARAGHWRLIGTAGYMLIVDQDLAMEADLLAARSRRLSRRANEPYHLVSSELLPDLNPGYLVVTPDPWANRDAAEAARRALGRRRAYVKQVWPARDRCDQ